MPGANHELWIPKGARPFKLYFFKLKIDGPVRLAQEQIIQNSCWALRSSMAAIVDSMQLKLMHHDPHLRGLLAILFSRVLRESASRIPGGALLSQAQRRHILRYVREHVTGRPTPRELADALHLSPDYFSRIFRRTFSVSPRRWLLNERIRLAAVLLAKPGISVSEVAYRFGYRRRIFIQPPIQASLRHQPQIFPKTSRTLKPLHQSFPAAPVIPAGPEVPAVPSIP